MQSSAHGSAEFSLGLVRGRCLTSIVLGSQVALIDINQERVEHIKEKTIHFPRAVSPALAAASYACMSVFGGYAPACQTIDMWQTVWDLPEAGREAEA